MFVYVAPRISVYPSLSPMLFMYLLGSEGDMDWYNETRMLKDVTMKMWRMSGSQH